MKQKILVIVESNTKAKTIKRFLGPKYQVQASNGHLIDLPKSKLGIDIENNFEPNYITIRGRGEILKNLKNYTKKADKVLMATDPDREGEAICWHLNRALKLDGDEPNRIEFHEITKEAVKGALQNPRHIAQNRVDAQQARRILDRLVGYQISPLLWKKVKKGLSAGRVQSVAVYLICYREGEIEAFEPEEYWTIDAVLAGSGKNSTPFTAQLQKYGNNKINISNEKEAQEIVNDLEGSSFQVDSISSRQVQRKPAPPFTTSSLQQEASQKMGFTTRKTMQLAQQLYEGINIGDRGMTGLVTYIRTDSVKVSQEATEQTREYIKQNLGEDYVPAKPHQFKSNQKAQEAHESIRPTDVTREPEQIKEYLSRDQHRLYKLIWNRFVASQTASATLRKVRVDIKAGDYQLKATGSQTVFPGFLYIYRKEKNKEKEEDRHLPELAEDEMLKLKSITPDQHFTQPPPRYNEASLVKTLEEKGIGRPSTYSPIIETIRSRGYVIMENKAFVPTELGKVVIDLLQEHFPEIIDVEFTAKMEEQLDLIEEGELDSLSVLREFYEFFKKRLEAAEKEMEEVELTPEYSEETCPKCGLNLVYRFGRYGRFLACPGFPDCRHTQNIEAETGVKCPEDNGDLVEKRTKKGRVFYGCSNYPDCTFSLWKKPLPEYCSVCGYFLVEQNKKKNIIVCANPDCSSHSGQKSQDSSSKTTQKV